MRSDSGGQCSRALWGLGGESPQFAFGSLDRPKPESPGHATSAAALAEHAR